MVKTMSRTLVIAAIFSLLLVADGFAKATVTHFGYNENDCFSWGAYKVCVSRKGNWHGVMTPANVRHWSYRYTYNTTYSHDNKVVSSSSGKNSYSYKMKDGQTFLYRNTFSYNSSVGCVKVNYSGTYQFVNGKMVRNSYNYSSPSSC